MRRCRFIEGLRQHPELAELALLGTMPDKEVAARISKSRAAVRAQRVRREIEAFTGKEG